MSFVQDVLKSAEAKAFDLVSVVLGIAPALVHAILMILALALCLIVVSMWLRRRSYRSWEILWTHVGLLLVFSALLVAPETARGAPDMLCSRYGGGKMTYSLLTARLVSDRVDDQYGNKSLALLVRAPLWGNETHLCIVSFADQRAQALFELLSRETSRRTQAGPEEGDITFTFGSPNEQPNVTFRPTHPPLGKDVPPEKPWEKL